MVTVQIQTTDASKTQILNLLIKLKIYDYEKHFYNKRVQVFRRISSI